MWHNVHTVCIFMHTGTQRKNVSKSFWLPGARVVEKVIPLLDCTQAPEEECQQRRLVARRASSGEGHSSA